jgi:Mn-dependent DtxR family transcriptional regulator
MRATRLRQADLNLLVVFSVLAEERNVSRAARRLQLSQPAVSRALQRMRDTFHDDLLVQTAKGYEPTPQGERVLQELENMLPKLERLISGSTFDPVTEHCSFRIAATDNATSIMAPVLCREVLPVARQVRFTFASWRGDVFEDLSHATYLAVFRDATLSASTIPVRTKGKDYRLRFGPSSFLQLGSVESVSERCQYNYIAVVRWKCVKSLFFGDFKELLEAIEPVLSLSIRSSFPPPGALNSPLAQSRSVCSTCPPSRRTAPCAQTYFEPPDCSDPLSLPNGGMAECFSSGAGAWIRPTSFE